MARVRAVASRDAPPRAAEVARAKPPWSLPLPLTPLPGLEASTGSLGQGLAVGLGIALGARMRGLGFHTFVMLGDGETQEGMIWESVMVAAKYGLGNLTAIVD